MKTKKQEALVNSFLTTMGDETWPLYLEIAKHLSELGYNPKKEGSRISFKHDRHNKQIAKMGTTRGKKPAPIFMLRFSACKDYSQKFADIVKDAVAKYPNDARNCIIDGCNYCAGEPITHVYSYTFPNGETKFHCGAYALKVPDITVDDMEEIKRLISEEHVYLMKHEAGVSES